VNPSATAVFLILVTAFAVKLSSAAGFLLLASSFAVNLSDTAVFLLLVTAFAEGALYSGKTYFLRLFCRDTPINQSNPYFFQTRLNGKQSCYYCFIKTFPQNPSLLLLLTSIRKNFNYRLQFYKN